MDRAREHEDLVRQYFATIIPPTRKPRRRIPRFGPAAAAYVPEHVHVDLPLQAYLRIHTSMDRSSGP